jgi:predicted DNA-binding protein with PD1-like motif/uncharacterized protein YjbJ (UPF0337 family)
MESTMNRLREKAQGRTKQAVGQIIGDDKLVLEGKEQERLAEEQRSTSEEHAVSGRDNDASPSKSGKHPMKSKSFKEGSGRAFVLILDQGEEAFKAITDFANRERIDGASITAIGAFSEAEIGWFDLAAKKYKPVKVSEQCEVLSLIGDLAKGDDGQASLHLHAVLGLQDGCCRGGHFLSGKVRPTLEVTIMETAIHLRRRKRADLGIALIDL